MSLSSTRHLFDGPRKSPPLSSQLPIEQPIPIGPLPIATYDCFGESTTVQHRIGFSLRDGRSWSYPTAFIGLVSSPSASELILSCRCGEVGQIVIEGQALHLIAESLRAGRLAFVKESEGPFAQAGSPCVSKISIHGAEG